MIKRSSSQAGSAHIVIIVILVIALLGALGYVFWQNTIGKNQRKAAEIVAKKEANKSEDITVPKEEMVTYRSEVIGVEFDYPKSWLKVECDNTYPENNPLNKVYFGTTDDGLAIVDGKSTQLCGGGSDFPPQMTFATRDDFDDALYLDYAKSSSSVTIDGKHVKKYVSVVDGDSSAAGLESTVYVYTLKQNQYIIMSYVRFPEHADGARDNSQESLDEFTDVVENSLRFL